MQENKSSKEGKEHISGEGIKILEDKRLNAVKRNFAIGIERTGIYKSVDGSSSRLKDQISKN